MTSRSLAWIAAIAFLAPTAARAEERNDLRLVQRLSDAATGAEIRVFKGSLPEVRLEVQSDQLLFHKRVTASTIELKIVAGNDAIDVTFEPRALIVKDSQGRVRATRQSPQSAATVKTMIARSRAAAAATSLLARLAIRNDSPVYQSIMSTRMMLEAVTGQRTAFEQFDAWHRALQQRLTLRRVSFGQTASECWNDYAKEAIDAWRQYEQCMADTSWYEIFDKMGCALVYDTRALGAFVWWLNCIGAMNPA